MTTTAIPSLDVNDFKSNIQDFDRMANGIGTYTDRFGDERLTLDEFMRRNSYEVPVAFASGISVSRSTQTVTYNGDTYHAAPAAIPFTTTGTFNAAQWLMLRQNLEPQGIVLADKVITGFDATGLRDGAWVNFAGRDTVGDGGGGLFRYSASSVQAADGGLVFAPTGGGRLFRQGWTMLGFNGAVNTAWWGMKGDGTTNNRLLFKSLVSAIAPTGGEVVFSPGSYLISGKEGTYALPDLDSNIQWTTTNYDVQLYFSGLSNIKFSFNGAEIVSDKTDGGITMVFDGCDNITFDMPKSRGATVMSGGTATTVGTVGIALLSLTKDSSNITFNGPTIQSHYAAIDIFGNPSSAFRVKNVTINGASSYRSGYYGVACRGNGVNVTVTDGYAFRLNRPFFIYDTQGVKMKMTCDEINGGFQALVKAYTQNTSDITVDMFVRNRANTQSCLGLQSQHNPSLQPTAAVLFDIRVKYDDFNSVAGGESIRFDYYQNSTLTSTSNQLLFTDIELVGRSSGAVISGVTLTSLSNPCILDISRFNASNSAAIYTGGSGFIPSLISSWTPTDASGAGLALATSNGRYGVTSTVQGVFDVTYPATSNTASAALGSLPVRSAALPRSAAAVTVSYTDCGFPIYGLIGSNDTKINWYKNTGVAVQNSELSGKTVRGSFSYAAG